MPAWDNGTFLSVACSNTKINSYPFSKFFGLSSVLCLHHTRNYLYQPSWVWACQRQRGTYPEPSCSSAGRRELIVFNYLLSFFMFQSSDKSLGLISLQSGHCPCPTGVLSEALPWMETSSTDFKGSFRSLMKVNYLVSFTTDLKSFMIGFYFYFSGKNQGHGQGKHLVVVKPADNSTSIIVLSVYWCTQQRWLKC